VIRPTQTISLSLLLVAAADLGLGSMAPVLADEAGATPATAERKICTRELRTGTKIPVKVCRTQAEIDAERQATQNAMKSSPSANYKRGT
jgi:hypothetical protein